MRYQDNDQLTNEDLVAIYPRRLYKKGTIEIWQFPYVKDEILYDEDSLVGIEFSTIAELYLVTPFKNRYEDKEYLNRIISLVHDLDMDFEVYSINKDLTVKEIIAYLETSTK